MGWKGTVRSISAAMRAAERDAQRSRKQALKSQIAAYSAEAVAEHEEYLARLVSIHANRSDKVDWLAMASKPKPSYPQFKPLNENSAEQALSSFKPRIFDRLRGGAEKRRLKLEQALVEAKAQDHKRFEKELSDYQESLKDWEEDTSLSKRLIAGEAAALKEVIEEMQTLTSESLLGSRVDFELDDDFVHAMPVVHSDEIVPKMRRKQLAGGRLAESKMPAAQFNELYEDYVSSVAIRVAGDIFSITPIAEAYVTCFSEMLNTATGYDEKTPILSVHFVRTKFEQLRLRAIDPSDAIGNFRHAVNFKRGKGFGRIEPIVASRSAKSAESAGY